MLPRIGDPVMVRDHLTRFRWQRFIVKAHTASGGRPAFTIDGHAGVFVDEHEHEHWRRCTALEAKGGK